MKQPIYKITVLKWREHNPTAKKHFKKTMIEHRLMTDAKINALPLSHKWLFINLLLICGEHANDTITMTQRQVNEVLTTREGASNALARLQSFQLIRYEEIVLIEENRIEENRKEKKRIEFPRGSKTPVVEAPEKVLNRKVWEAYENAYLLRYKISPVRNASVNSKISQFAKRLGTDAISVISFYLTHNDYAYVKAMHSIGLALSHAEALRTQWAKGKAITSSDVRNFEKKQEFNNLISDIEENGI